MKIFVIDTGAITWTKPEIEPSGHRPHIYITLSGSPVGDNFDFIRVSDGYKHIDFRRNPFSLDSKFRYVYGADPQFVAYIL